MKTNKKKIDHNECFAKLILEKEIKLEEENVVNKFMIEI